MGRSINDTLKDLLLDSKGDRSDAAIGTLAQGLEAIGAGVFNVQAFGVIGDGVTDDRAAIQALIDSTNLAGGGTLYFPVTSGGYLVGTPGLNMKSNVTLKGDVRERGSKLFRNGPYTLINSIGISILTDPSGAGHIKRWRLEDLWVDGADQAAPLVDVRASDLLEFNDVRFSASTQELFLCYELYDSRFYNCRFTFGGDSGGTYYATNLKSGTDGVVTWEFTNQIHFYSCVWEDNRNKVINVSGSTTNEIFFVSCKGENVLGMSDMFNFSGCTNISFDQFQVTTRGVVGQTIAEVFNFTNVNTLFGKISWEHIGTVPIDANVDAGLSSASPTASAITHLAAVTNCTGTDLDFYIYTPCRDKISSTEVVTITGNTTNVDVRVHTQQNNTKKNAVTSGVPNLTLERQLVFGFTTAMGIRFGSGLSTLSTTGRWDFGRITDDGGGAPIFNIVHNDGSTDTTIASMRVEGDFQFGAGLKVKTTNSISAAGNSQGTATALAYKNMVNNVTSVTAASAEGVILPSSGTGKWVWVKNSHATDTLKVYPANGGTIDGAAANASVTIAAGKTRIFITVSSNNWISMLGA